MKMIYMFRYIVYLGSLGTRARNILIQETKVMTDIVDQFPAGLMYFIFRFIISGRVLLIIGNFVQNILIRLLEHHVSVLQ